MYLYDKDIIDYRFLTTETNLKALYIIYFVDKYFYFLKGQLISKCPFGIIVWTKIPTKLFLDF